MSQVKGVIFDMDGVVVDNHRFHFKAWMQFSQKYKFPLDAQIYRDKFNGKTNADLFTMIFGDVSAAQIKSYANEKEGLYKDLYASEMMTHKGLIDFLEYLGRKKIKIALGTSAPPENVDFTLDGLTIRKYFPVIVDGSMVSIGKPDPQVYKLCCARLGLDPKDCVVFEDALLGLEAGERAGCKIVAVATSHEVYELKSKTENIIFDFTEARKFID
jgi:beta-phosphoglucomutase family hydrolase